MTIYATPCIWLRGKKVTIRKKKQAQVRAFRMFLEMRKRPRIFPPGPYLTERGNMKFLGRDLTKS